MLKGLERPDLDAELLALDTALERLGTMDERLRQVVECRFFAGMSEQEIAEVLGLTARTVQNCLRRAKHKLYFGLKQAGLAPALA